MNRLRMVLAALCATAAAGCTPVARPAPPAACDASGLQSFVGQPDSVLAATEFAVPIRILRPGTAVTTKYDPARLNFFIDAQGRIERVSCG